MQWCGADRLGHGVRIIDDITVQGDGTAKLGRLAAYVRDKRIPLEMCPTSNLQTGAATSIAEHPIGLLRSLSFRVTVDTDNRLMSATSLSGEFSKLRGVRLRLGRHAVVHDQRHEVGVPAVRRAPRADQRCHQAWFRAAQVAGVNGFARVE